ncbi:MAG: nicotinate-nicotinamide nucleotide adenylyltransferase [Bryobacteraceae bacterium]
MKFYRGSGPSPARLGILAGSFNPPTIAHRELARAARRQVDAVLCVLPRRFPHKEYFGATLEQRLEMLGALNLGGIATSDGSLYIEIARECRLHYGPSTDICVLCGTDAAERILTWDYGRPGVAEEMLSEFELLVAPRGRAFEPPAEFRDRIAPLHLAGNFHPISSSEVRERIRTKEPWEHLVPAEIVEKVRRIYS